MCFSINIKFIFIFIGDGRVVPDTEFLRKHLLREGHINKPELGELLTEVTKILSK